MSIQSELSMDGYQELANLTAIYPSDVGMMYCALGLCGESGEVADKLKKVIRDNNGELSDEVRLQVGKELGDVLWYVANLSTELGFSLEEIARMNIEKLRSRSERGVLGGNGDER